MLRMRRLRAPASPIELPEPLTADGLLWTAAMSLDDQSPPPTDELIQLTLRVCERAVNVTLPEIAARAAAGKQRTWVNQWPGEHYRFLAALVEEIEPSLVVEVGTFTGMGSLSLLATLPDAGRVVTYDLIPWQEIPATLLVADDFGVRFEQRLGDLSDATFFAEQRAVLSQADLIFIDGPKDGSFEPAFLDLLLPTLKKSAVVVLDDIKFANMLGTWRTLPLPKLDVTSFAHWSGTGIAFASDVADEPTSL